MEEMKDLIIEYDKSQWHRGPWDTEPDRVDFIHAGFSCFILRNHLGSWCGYVGVPETHPSFGKDNNDVDVSVHGGLTYSGECSPPICHIPQPNMPERVWWLGFDTGHWNDLTPSLVRHGLSGIYRDMNYVTKETKELAEQLEKLK